MPTPLDRPPIVEALLDFRVRVSEGSSDRLDTFAEAVRPAFPTEVMFPDPGEAPASLRTLLGALGPRKRLRSEDGRRTVLVGLDRLTFSATFTPPDVAYTDWERELEVPAFEAWATFQESLQPRALSSLATRFVNRISARADRPAEAFTSPPELPIPNAVLSAFDDRRSGRTLDGYGVRIGRRLGARPDGTARAALFVDVEAFKTYDDPPRPPVDRNDLAPTLVRLRALKNDLFHGSVAPATLAQYRDDNA